MGELTRFRTVDPIRNGASRQSTRPVIESEMLVDLIADCVLAELNRMPSALSMDALDRKLYLEACGKLRNADHVYELQKQLRIIGSPRPRHNEFRALIQTIVDGSRSEINRLCDGQRQAYREFSMPTNAIPAKSSHDHIAEILRKNRERAGFAPVPTDGESSLTRPARCQHCCPEWRSDD